MEELAELAPAGNRRLRDNQEMRGADSHRYVRFPQVSNMTNPLRHVRLFDQKAALNLLSLQKSAPR